MIATCDFYRDGFNVVAFTGLQQDRGRRLFLAGMPIRSCSGVETDFGFGLWGSIASEEPVEGMRWLWLWWYGAVAPKHAASRKESKGSAAMAKASQPKPNEASNGKLLVSVNVIQMRRKMRYSIRIGLCMFLFRPPPFFPAARALSLLPR